MKAQCLRKILTILCLLSLPLTGRAVEDNRFSLSEVRALPPYCSALGEGYYRPDALKGRYKAKTPIGFSESHHFCQGLVFILRADRALSDPESKKFNLASAVGELTYTLHHVEKNKAVSRQYLSLIHHYRGEALRRSKNTGEMLQDYLTAINLNPKSVPSYAAVSDFYVSQNMRSDAKAIIDRGLAQNPSAKALLRRKQELLGGR